MIFLESICFRTKWPNAIYFTIKQNDKFMSLKLNNLLKTPWSSHDRTIVNLMLLLEVVLQKNATYNKLKQEDLVEAMIPCLWVNASYSDLF